ncbi:flagellar export chaperone FliS [Nitrosospira multiformis]|uniref:Flagellar protein FliS n=1 Tax=Nitrosospira multiformis (strain ATCC 25196 / NCIMB 11849 / C 71) TaxID=323848 RepID=Q2Y9C8_NITMU|nr:flagellar export chaperone FliS [Nitrosospira multiformis]ABB74643.1 flagellar protein FliS [Nitrosospira multiformis ATCC 25196]SDZ83572.1 flagellar protein FliS [Nitrosospira multiformis]SEF72430.1 flagellar protein FliS [Nitrosospira multiformis ATCC 25196]
MYSVPRCGVNAYARVGLETGVIAASPHKLVLMLFEGARIALASALTHTRSGQIAARGEAISKAIAIINSGLQASLDIKAGGELAQQLNALYEYMGRRLLQANVHDKPEYIEEVSGLLGELHEAWEAIGSFTQSGGEGEMISSVTHDGIANLKKA